MVRLKFCRDIWYLIRSIIFPIAVYDYRIIRCYSVLLGTEYRIILLGGGVVVWEECLGCNSEWCAAYRVGVCLSGYECALKEEVYR